MNNSKTDKAIIDIRGYSCPISLALVAKTMNSVASDTAVNIISDDISVKKDIERWSIESGNAINNITINDSLLSIEIIKGKGYKPHSLIDAIQFILLGVRLHIYRFYVSIFKRDNTKHLITFVSVAEGMRAHYWMENTHPDVPYVLLPVPRTITKHCGVVMGVHDKAKAKALFALLQENNYKTEEIYVKKKYIYIQLDN